MTAFRQVAADAASVADALVPKFEQSDDTSWFGNSAWWCQEASLDVGTQPSMARVYIPITDGVDDENANICAFDPQGPGNFIKVGMWCQIAKRGGGVVFVGKVIRLIRDRDADALVAEIADVRQDLLDLTVKGSYTYTGESIGGGTVYRMGWPAHFNPGGRPNCIYDPYGNPEFAPHPDYGLEGDEAPPDPGDGHNSKACYWSLESILAYLRNHYNSDATIDDRWPLLPKAPSWLEWPKGFAAGIDKESVANFDSAIGQGNQNRGGARKGRDMILEGYSLLEAIQLLLDTAGGYSLAVLPEQVSDSEGNLNLKNVLYALNMRFIGGGASIPYGHSDDPGETAFINGGQFIEDGEDYASGVMGASQLALIERRLSSREDSEAEEGQEYSLKVAWTSERQDAFLEHVGTYNNEIGWREACSLYPEVFTTYKIVDGFDFQANTEFADYPRASIGRPPWPTLLSFMTDLSGAEDFAGLRWPVYVEVNISTDPETPSWILGPMFDGLEVLDNGIIHLPVLRDLSADVRGWRALAGNITVPFKTDYAGYEGKAPLVAREIRMTLAIPCDHAISHSVTMPRDDINMSSAVSIETYKDNPDVARIAYGHNRLKYVDLQQLYAYHTRYNSYPEPESGGGSVYADGAIRDDTELLKSHVRRQMYFDCRLKRDGNVRVDGHIVTTYKIGEAVKNFTPNAGGGQGLPVNGTIAGITWKSTGGDNPATSTEYRII